MEFKEINLTKKDVNKIEELLDVLREWGYAHTELDSGEEIIFSCKELVKDKKDYEKDIKQIQKEDFIIAK